VRWAIDSVVQAASLGYLRFEVTTTDTLGDLDGLVLDGDNLNVFFEYEGVADQVSTPNAAARARVTYETTKTGEITFDCDWVGGFVVQATRLLIERVSVTPNPDEDFYPAHVRLAVTVGLNAEPPPFPPQMTVPPAQVDAGASRTIPIPSFARRLTLLARYGDEVSGDAPLGQIFVAFGVPFVGSLGFIDAATSSDALFGDGLVIPHGATEIVLSNASSGVLRLGAVFHLGL
jgi:hypothetical protein